MKYENNEPMKKLRVTLIAIISLSFGGYSQAQGIVNGTNLNIGSNNTLNQSHGNAIGDSHWIGGYHSLAIGNNDTILNNGNSSIAIGSLNRIEKPMSMAIGINVKISDILGIGIGHYLKLQGSSGCMAIGSGITGTSITPDRFLENNYSNSLLIGFNSTKPTLTIGTSPNEYSHGSYDRTGKVGIGDIPMPELAAKLHIRSDAGENASLFLEPKVPSSDAASLSIHDTTHYLQVDSTGCMTMSSKNGTSFAPLILVGRVGVNAINESEDYALAVNGGVLTNEVMIREVENWYDNVFEKGYNLLTLGELQRFIDKNGHLPEVPSEKEVRETGYKMTEMQGILLKKIEELTLYVLEQKKCMEKLEQKIQELERK